MLVFTVIIINLFYQIVAFDFCKVNNFNFNIEESFAHFSCQPELLENENGEVVAHPLTVCIQQCKNNPFR